MTATYLTPGVYVEELPGGARAIEGVATSNTLFAGFTLRGPIGMPQRIASWSEYVATFGGVNATGASIGINDFRAGTPAVDYMGHALLSYFQNGGKIAYVARMAGEAKKALGAMFSPVPLAFEAISAGAWANGLSVEVETDPINTGKHIVKVGRLDAKGALTEAEVFTGVDVATQADDYHISKILAASSALVRIADPATMVAPTEAAATQLSKPVGATITVADTANGKKFLLNVNGTDVTAVEAAPADYTPITLAAELQTKIQAAASGAGVTVTVVTSGALTCLRVTTPTAAAPSISVKGNAGTLGNQLGFIAGEGTIVGDGTATLGSGQNGTPAGTADYTAMFGKLELATDVNVIVLPNAAWDGSGNTTVEAALAHCEKMGNRVLIIDPKRGEELKTPQTVSGEGYPTSTYSQLYYPWARVPNPIYHPDRAPTAPRQVLIPPSSFAAGMWGRIDARRGVWKAPAGVETALVGVASFEFDVGDPQQEVLNPAGVNALRRKPGYGNVIWGARTLATRANPEWRYVPVRRTAIMFEEALRRGIQWAVFEGNDHKLWSSLRVTAESYMDGLFRSGAFQGERTSDAYKVECGLGSTMTQGDIDRGYVILKIMFAPLKPAEFVVIQIQQLAGQV